MCTQTIIDGFQHEQPDYWLTFGNPWEIERLMVAYPIKLYGHVSATMEGGKQVFKWNAGEQVCGCIPKYLLNHPISFCNIHLPEGLILASLQFAVPYVP